MIGWILLIAHLLICVAVYAASRAGTLKNLSIMMPMVLFIPFWGAACVLMLHFDVLNGKRIALDYDRLDMTDEIYSAISISSSDDGRDVVPMEEALLMDSPQQCREMVLDMLLDDPNRYLHQLQKIRSADDVEVVHYATTVMVEISKQYEAQWQKWNSVYNENPENIQALDQCCAYLKEYLAADLQQGYAKQILLNRYIELLDTRFSRQPELSFGVELAENLMQNGEYTRARGVLDQLLDRWPTDGDAWMAHLRYLIRQKQGNKIKQTIAHIEEQGIMLSAHERETIEFWKS